MTKKLTAAYVTTLKPMWSYTISDINKLGTDWDLLNSVYQCMMSKKCCKPATITNMHEFMLILKYVSKKSKYAKIGKTMSILERAKYVCLIKIAQQ